MADDAGAGCIDLTPAADCPAGTRATLGSAQCQPVAAPTCGTGFAPDPSGWGCIDVQPAAACTGASLETLGSTTCATLGDCNAAFPASGATIFVAPTQSVDATHFTTIQSAIDAAPSGATIAIDSGTYTEALTITHSVTLAGRCAAMVNVVSPDGTKPGIAAQGTLTLKVSGLSLRQHLIGVNVTGGSTTLDAIFIDGAIGRGVRVGGGAVHIDGSRIFGVTDDSSGIGFGLDVSGGSVDVTGSAIVKSGVAGINATSSGKATIHASIVRDTDGGNGADGQGVGASISGGGQLDIEASAFTGNHVANVVVLDPRSLVTINGSVIRKALVRTDGGYGDGIIVMAGGEADIGSSTLSGSGEWGITSDGPNAILKLNSSVIRGGVATARGGIAAEAGTGLTMNDVAVVGVRGEGVVLQDKGSTGTLTSLLVRDITPTTSGAADDGVGLFLGVGAVAQVTDLTTFNAAADAVWVGGDAQHANGSQATIARLLAIATAPGKDGRFGRGIEIGAGANANVDSSAFVGSAEAAVVVDAYASATITNSVLRSSGSPSTNAGFGFLVIDSATASLSGSWVREINGVGLAFGGSAAAGVDGTVVLNNLIGVYADPSTTLSEVSALPSDLSLGSVDVSNTQFVGNQTKISADTIPLPDVNASRQAK